MQDNIKKLLKLPSQTLVFNTETKHTPMMINLLKRKEKRTSTSESTFSKIPIIEKTTATKRTLLYLADRSKGLRLTGSYLV